MKEIKRQKDCNDILILKNWKEVYLDIQEFLSQYKVDWVIRIQNTDIEFIKDKEIYAHFNLQISNHKVWQIYLLPKILRNGYFDEKNNIEVLPLLEVDEKLIFECIDVQENLSYSQIWEKHLQNSLDYIKNVDDLKEHIYFKYSKSMPNLTKEQILDLGVSYTLLKRK